MSSEETAQEDVLVKTGPFYLKVAEGVDGVYLYGTDGCVIYINLTSIYFEQLLEGNFRTLLIGTTVKGKTVGQKYIIIFETDHLDQLVMKYVYQDEDLLGVFVSEVHVLGNVSEDRSSVTTKDGNVLKPFRSGETLSNLILGHEDGESRMEHLFYKAKGVLDFKALHVEIAKNNSILTINNYFGEPITHIQVEDLLQPVKEELTREVKIDENITEIAEMTETNDPTLKIKERPNGDAEFIHSDFMIKLPIKFSRILDNLNYSTLGNVGSRYNPDGSQDNVYVVIHYNPDTGHSVTITDSNSKRHYSLEKEEFPEGTVRQVSEDMFVLSTNGPILNLYTDLYFSGNIVKEIRQHKGKDGTIIFRESLFRYPSGRTHEPYELTVIFRESGDHFGILIDRAKGSVLGRFRLALDLQEQLEKVEPSDKPINVTLEIAKKEDNMFGLPKIEDVRKKTDEALEISIAKIGSAITEASTLGESSVLISKGGFPDSSLRRIMEEISKTGYMVSHISSGELVIAW